MLVELWERFRGYNDWILAEATIESSQMEDHEVSHRGQVSHLYESGDTIVWIDRQGNRQTAFCRVPDDSALYQLIGGEKIAIRYNPDKPDQYFFPELLKAQIHNYVSAFVALTLFVLLVTVPVLLFFHVFG
jgi:hypothetical protein